MSNKKPHIIQKQVINIKLPDAKAALEWEVNQRRNFTALINKQLEKCFDEHDKAGQYLIIEKLDIDLGIFTVENLQEEMPGRLYEKLYKTLEEKTKEISTDKGYYDGETRNTGYVYSGQEGKLEALFFFLNKGYLPWWGSELAGWDKNWLQSLTGNEINKVKTFLAANNERPVRRLATQFDDSFMQQLVQSMGVTDDTENAWNWLKRVLESLPQIQAPQNFKTGRESIPGHHKFLSLPAVRVNYWVEWIRYALGQRQIFTLYNLFDKQQKVLNFITLKFSKDRENNDFFGNIPAIWQAEVEMLTQPEKEKIHMAHTNKKGRPGPESDSMPQDLFQGNITNKENKPTDKEAFTTREKTLHEDEPQSSDEILLKHQPDVSGRKNTEEDTDAIFVNDAGLILLHPFLPELFRQCGWLEKNRFVNDDTRAMAVYALHYLATGEVGAFEHQLVFPRFLAGMEWEALLEPVEQLNDLEQAACNDLLAEVLKHWRPLRNTSPQGLREGFLQRNGKLEHIYSGWHLGIEQKTLDILLSQLPWGISLIKLPWMKNMLTVTWQ